MAFYRYELKKNPPKNGNTFAAYKKVIYYDYHEVDNLISDLDDQGYLCCQINEGCLGSGNWICVAPDDKHYHFIIEEKALSEWQSGHRIYRRKQLITADLIALDAYERRMVML